MGKTPPGPFRRFLKRHAPTREELVRSRWLKPVRHYIDAHEYWRFTRRSVPRAVLVGMFIGIFLMVPGLQMFAAAALSIPLRANIPIAAAITWVSNPATTPVFLFAGLEVGSLLGFQTNVDAFLDLIDRGASLGEWTQWALSDAAPAVIIGLFVIAVVLAFVAYWVSLVGWRLWIARRWKQRSVEGNSTYTSER
ncbi:DUF2062 domain-containing protein [Sphingomicrobium arenosum]|uniref:DUF2062 domain-containing protein n=1 Tax=Sphingomicrobium arenosum TaxID=2233861 RepID=UPI00223F720D|nr:DUF2062 domain-containing protein [Sphingomicrobium arenosum]